MSSCILYQNHCATVTLLDIPRSIELAQGLSNFSRLISTEPLDHPYPSVNPKSAKARANLGEPSLEDLLLQKHLELALEEVRGCHEGPWCLPRLTTQIEGGHLMEGKKRRMTDSLTGPIPPASQGPDEKTNVEADHVVLPDGCIYFHKAEQRPLNVIVGAGMERATIPPSSTFLQGDISETLDTFKKSAPKFSLVVLDPPWPNRSARRKRSYSISYGNSEIRSLLSSIPLYDHLTEDGLVAVWVTNKISFQEMILGEGGLFQKWGIQLVEKWIWLKITSNGEPASALDLMWRKPFEVLLVGRRGTKQDGDVKRKVIVGVSDLHSRKPNLKMLFEGMLGRKEGEYEALEIFARNLTAGWWSWGNESLKFQMEEYWGES